MGGDSANMFAMLRQAIEICRPDLRQYYRITRKAKIVASYPANGVYYADVQPLRNDETPDPKEPVVPKVAVPVFWGGASRGIVCPPAVGTLCDLTYYDGDPNYPCISNLRWSTTGAAPAAELDELIIQQEPGVSIKIDNAHHIITVSSGDWKVRVDGDAVVEAGGNALIKAKGTLTIQAPQIVKKGNETGMGADGGIGSVSEHANRKITGSLHINGGVTISGNLSVAGSSTVAGNAHAGSRSGGAI